MQTFPQSMIEVSREKLEDNLAELVAEVGSEIERTDEGGRGHNHPPDSAHISSTGSNSIWAREYLLPSNTAYHDLSISTLREIPLYLCDALIRPEATIPTTLDHLRYWGWTAAVASGVFEASDERFDNLFDFELVVHLGLLPIRLPSEIPNSTFQALRFYRERFILLSGFSTLEGLICEFSDSVAPDGTVTVNEIEASWKPERIDESNRRYTKNDEVSKYHDILQIWRTQDEKPESVQYTLNTINDLQRYDTETLLWKFENVDNKVSEEIEDQTYNFLRIIGKHRNKNYHGEQVTRTLAPVVLTLCCLVIWENIDSDGFEELAEEVIDSVAGHLIHPLWPAAFYPVKSD